MSILASAAEPVTTVQLAWGGVFVAFGLAVACAIGVFRRDSVNGPVRIGREEPIGPLLIVFVAGLATWFGLQAAYGIYVAIEQRLKAPGASPAAIVLDAKDYAILGTIPFIAGLAVLVAGDRLASRSLPQRLGATRDRAPAGIAKGLLGFVIIFPILLGGGIGLEALYQAIGYEHPTAHELLKVLGESRDPVLRIALVIGATLLAPLFEECFFRGHLQTIFVRFFTPRPPRRELPVAQVTPETEPLPPPVMIDSPEPPAVPGAARWAAIALTSLLFAVLHPAWTWPLIFVLSIGMGYAYERTGNLWVPIVMHFLFNTANTVITLLSDRFEQTTTPL